MPEGVKYEFECINYTTYKLVTTMKASGKLFDNIFIKSKHKLARTKGITVRGDIENINEFEVIAQYLPLIKTAMKKPLGTIQREILADNISFITIEIKKGKFTREKEGNWKIEITFEGDYVDNR